jgi:hypothetical protein
MTNRFGFWFAHLNILVICAVLLGGFVVEFVGESFPARSVSFSAWP